MRLCTASPPAASSPTAGPIVRVTHVGRYTTFLRAAPSPAALGASSRAAAPVGMYWFQSGIQAFPTECTAPPMVPIAPVPSTRCAAATVLSNAGTELLTTPSKWFATKAAAAWPKLGWSNFSLRSDFISSPVLIFTGQASWHMPSAAHVCSALYTYMRSKSSSLATSSSVGLSSARSLLISRKTVMRWRGVSVTSRDGQFFSQKPHSMQRSTMAELGGESLRLFLWMSGSLLRMTPGLST
mmetsp:Transcript_10978/g.45498  ORF Transcript_10978/g.45498 Transcript_10978/m.45498 type:complete len:240 (-) Transcript_10978:1738-2457(-)